MIPYNQLTPLQKDLLGKEVTLSKNSTLVLKSFDKVGRRFYAYFYCNVCSLDTELYPSGLFRSKVPTEVIEVQKPIPCGCAVSPRYTEEQYKVLVRRRCKALGFTFKGWEGTFNNSRTYLRLENPTTGVCWNNSVIYTIMSKDLKDPVQNINCAIDNNLLPIEVVKSKMTVRQEEKVLNLKESGSNYLEYTCRECSSDEYVVHGLCKGIFYTNRRDFLQGGLSCRCVKYLWSKEQRTHQVNKQCNLHRFTFNGWIDKDYSSISKISVTCLKGHTASRTLNTFIDNENPTCVECLQVKMKKQGFLNGYYEDRKEECDNLYLISFNEQYLKVGRAFNIPKRFEGHKGLVKLSGIDRKDITLLKSVQDSHQNIYELEQKIHSMLREEGFGYNSGWSTETFSQEALPRVLELITNLAL